MLRSLRAAACALLLAALSGCSSFPASTVEASTPAGRALLETAADAHGWAEYRRLKDISVRYEGRWLSFAAKVQPVLVDDRFRGASEERLLIGSHEIGQFHRGPGGTKAVARTGRTTQVWYDGAAEADREKLLAASLVADAYRLFLLGPIYLLEQNARVEALGTEMIDGVEHERLHARLRPGLGHPGEERIVMWIDKRTSRARRLWMSADALPSTQGVIAEIDLLDYRQVGGVHLPTRYFERLKRPLLIDIHEWRLTGLDLDRGFESADILGPAFLRAAATPAKDLPVRD